MQDSAQILERLQLLERSNRRMKKAGVALGLGALGLLAAAFMRPEPAPILGALKGTSLELSSASGEPYATLNLDPKGFPLLHMKKGKSYALVSLQGPAIHLRSEEYLHTAYLGIDSMGNSKLELTANSTLDGARVIVKPDGTAGFYGLDDKGYDRFRLETTPTGHSALNLYGPLRSLRSSTGVDDKGNVSQIFLDTSGRRRAGMLVKPDGTPEITLTDDKERPRLNMTTSWDGAAKVQFLRSDGQVGVEHP